MSDSVSSRHFLDQMAMYYRARAAEYDEWFYRYGRFDHGAAATKRWFTEVDEICAVLDTVHLAGDILELAPGTGIWTERLLQTADSITAIDASPEMIAINQAKVAGGTRVMYLVADIFAWQPDRSYSAVFFGFWLSHVPTDRLAAFLTLVASALQPGGLVFFVDSQRAPEGAAVDHTLPNPADQIMTRRLNDGREFRIVKNFYDPAVLASRFAAAGLEMTICETPTYFIYGHGVRR